MNFDGYFVDLRLGHATYYLPDGEGLKLPTHRSAVAVAAQFNTDVVKAAIREAQALVPGYTYKGFCDKVKRAGCAGHSVRLGSFSFRSYCIHMFICLVFARLLSITVQRLALS